jgi:hypothetical protein
MPIAPTRWLVGLHRRFTSKTAVHRLRLGPASCGERRARGSATASEDDAAHRQSECNRARAMLRGASDDRVRLHCAFGVRRAGRPWPPRFCSTQRFGHKHDGPYRYMYERRPQHDEYATTAPKRRNGKLLLTSSIIVWRSWCGVDDLMSDYGHYGHRHDYGPIRCARANWHEPGGGLGLGDFCLR